MDGSMDGRVQGRVRYGRDMETTIVVSRLSHVCVTLVGTSMP